jgi:uncharacterized protein YkwD
MSSAVRSLCAALSLSAARSPDHPGRRPSLIAIVATAISALTLSACAGDSGPDLAELAALSLNDLGRSSIEAVNEARAVARTCGTTDYAAAGPVQWDARLADAALMQADYLQQENLFTHSGEGNSTVGDRALMAGYDWRNVGENLAAGHTTLERVMEDWIKSPGHCATLMNPNFVDAGFAFVQGEAGNRYRSYWALVMGRPRH